MRNGNGKRLINSCDGAIFMCNNLRKKESFRRKLFGLQSNHSDFVKLIKTGTILFLFEPEERKLNGVFRATSDGTMNIVPSAFSSSQKRFPAQVRFETLRACRPLSENEFREAIKENYFTPTKFTFALSRQQVCKLIFLFSSRSGFSCDWFPGGIRSEFMKTQEGSDLARRRATGNEKLLKFATVGYIENNNIQCSSNPISSARGEDHLMNYHNHDLLDMRLHNHMVRRQHELYPTVSRSLDSRTHDQMLSRSCYDLPISSVPEENHLKSYRNHELHDVTLQNHMVRRQHEPYPGVSHTLESQQPDHLLSNSCYDLPVSSIGSENHLASYHNLGSDDIRLQTHVARPQHEFHTAICHTLEPRQSNAIVSEHHYGLSTESIPYSSYLRHLHKKPSPFLGTEHPYLHKRTHDLCTDSSLDFKTSHFRTKSYTSTPHLGSDYFTLTNYPGSDISKSCPLSEPSNPSPLSPEGHVNFCDFNESASPEGSHLPLERLQTITSPSLHLRNTRAYSRPTQQEGASSSIQDYSSPSLVDYVPISDEHILVDSNYNQVLEDEVVNEEEAFKLFPVRNKFHYHPSFTTDTNFPASDDFDLVYNGKTGASDLMFSQSSVVQKRCSVFSRLSRSTKNFKCPRRNLSAKMNRKPEILETLENDAQPLDNIGENGLLKNCSSAEIVIEEPKESSGSLFRNFKRRSTVKQESTAASDLGKYKKRKIVRPSFTEGDDSSQLKNSGQNHLLQAGERPGNVANLGPSRGTVQHENSASTTDSSAIDIRGSQQTLHHQSEVGEKFLVDLVAQEARNSYRDVTLNDNAEGKRKNLRDLPFHSLALLEQKHKVIHESENSSSVVIDDNADGKEKSLCGLLSHSSALLQGKSTVIHESENCYSVVVRNGVDGKEENSRDQPPHFSASLEEMHEATYESENIHDIVFRSNNVSGKSEESLLGLASYSSALLKASNNSTDVFSTSSTFVSNGLTEKDSSTNTDMNCMTIVNTDGNDESLCGLLSHSSALPQGKNTLIHESENSYSVVRNGVDGKEENSRDLPLYFSASLEEMHEATYEPENSHDIVFRGNNDGGKSEQNLLGLASHSALLKASNNSTDVFSTSSTFVSDGLPEKDSSTNTDMNCMTIVNTDGKEESLCGLLSHSSALLQGKSTVIHESESSYSVVRNGVDGKEEDSRDLPLHVSTSLGEMHEATYESESCHDIVFRGHNVGGKLEENSLGLASHSSVLLEASNNSSNSTDVFSTSSTFVTDGLPEKDSSTNTDMNCMTIVKMGSLGFPLSI